MDETIRDIIYESYGRGRTDGQGTRRRRLGCPRLGRAGSIIGGSIYYTGRGPSGRRRSSVIDDGVRACLLPPDLTGRRVTVRGVFPFSRAYGFTAAVERARSA